MKWRSPSFFLVRSNMIRSDLSKGEGRECLQWEGSSIRDQLAGLGLEGEDRSSSNWFISVTVMFVTSPELKNFSSCLLISNVNLNSNKISLIQNIKTHSLICHIIYNYIYHQGKILLHYLTNAHDKSYHNKKNYKNI